ncbi:MAG: Ribonuclease 3 [candidate division WS6 bacterium GW2011_GWF2_39_15]|uniref:Ribonuclease 3 n=1 Tax=candidate division WS6 bacterium GW2011_GWF2_39_15 TaxID=1619100 RepID=A0A0G0MSU4_9BACT|nr:MAG: Ribonuclease 3 [candidate division WS6 bacterium GW2011_GWF2_39_15]
MEDLKAYLEKLGIRGVKNISYFEEAFTHRSYVNEAKRKQGINHNERLEFLGDAVLELIISQYLFQTFPDRPEGELTSFRAATVKTETLASVARTLGYGQYLRMSNGEEATGGRDKDYLLANTFEAVLGALYLDQGIEACESYVREKLIILIPSIVENRLDIDPKTKFQELAQELFKVTPIYEVIKEEGPDHNKIFTMAVIINGKELGRGEGASKQKAEEQAATAALLSVAADNK